MVTVMMAVMMTVMMSVAVVTMSMPVAMVIIVGLLHSLSFLYRYKWVKTLLNSQHSYGKLQFQKHKCLNKSYEAHENGVP